MGVMISGHFLKQSLVIYQIFRFRQGNAEHQLEIFTQGSNIPEAQNCLTAAEQGWALHETFPSRAVSSALQDQGRLRADLLNLKHISTIKPMQKNSSKGWAPLSWRHAHLQLVKMQENSDRPNCHGDSSDNSSWSVPWMNYSHSHPNHPCKMRQVHILTLHL